MLACQEADAWAEIGAAEPARAALQRAEEARQHASRDPVGAFLACGESAPTQLRRFSAASHRRGRRAIEHAQHALTEAAGIPRSRTARWHKSASGPPQRTSKPAASTARYRVLSPVLGLPPEQRLDPLFTACATSAEALAGRPVAAHEPRGPQCSSSHHRDSAPPAPPPTPVMTWRTHGDPAHHRRPRPLVLATRAGELAPASTRGTSPSTANPRSRSSRTSTAPCSPRSPALMSSRTDGCTSPCRASALFRPFRDGRRRHRGCRKSRCALWHRSISPSARPTSTPSPSRSPSTRSSPCGSYAPRSAPRSRTSGAGTEYPEPAEPYNPHLSLAYTNTDGPAVPLIEALSSAPNLSANAVIDSCQLIVLNRDEGCTSGSRTPP